MPGDMQQFAIEQLSMMLLLADNVDRIFERCPPRQFLPVLAKIFIDQDASLDVLEAAMRAVTFYLDVHVDTVGDATCRVWVRIFVVTTSRILQLFTSGDVVSERTFIRRGFLQQVSIK
jgi:hypothetical protein